MLAPTRSDDQRRGVSAIDGRGYREAQSAAGLVSGRLHLLACSRGPAPQG